MNIVQALQLATKVESFVRKAEDSPAFQDLKAKEPELEKEFDELVVAIEHVDFSGLFHDIEDLIAIFKGK